MSRARGGSSPTATTRCAGDCNDADAGAIAFPFPVRGMDLDPSLPPGADPLFFWPSQTASAGSSTVYDIFTGDAAVVASSGSFGSGTCFADNYNSNFLFLTLPTPPPGHASYFMVRAQNRCPLGTGTYGSIQRDQGTAASASPCP
ncbi:MAG: hypothetical protein HY049_08030 [Acidobacteria bacterium]|nr:hypothetical protein [Acidobacteriota bacterium]